MVSKKLNVELGNFFYHISGISESVPAEERLAMQESIIEVWEYFMMCDGEYCENNDDSIKLSFDADGTKTCSENHFKSFEEFYMSNKLLFTPAIIANIMRTGEAIAKSCYDTSEVDTDIKKVLKKIFFK